jgi:hypothetical protein
MVSEEDTHRHVSQKKTENEKLEKLGDLKKFLARKNRTKGSLRIVKIASFDPLLSESGPRWLDISVGRLFRVRIVDKAPFFLCLDYESARRGWEQHSGSYGD